MKILLTTYQFFPDFSAGTEVLTYGVAKELQRRGHQVLVFTALPRQETLADSSRFDCYSHDGIPVERFFHGLMPMGGQTNVMEMEYDNHLVASYFRKLLARERPDAVHFFHLGRISSSPLPECSAAGVPAFYTPTDYWAVCPTKQLLLPEGGMCRGPDPLAANCLRHMALREGAAPGTLARNLPELFWRLGMRIGTSDFCSRQPRLAMVRALAQRRETVISRLNTLDAIFLPTTIVGEFLRQAGVRQDLLRACPYGIDPDFEMVSRSAAAQGRLRVGFIGTLAEHKGAHLLIRAVRGVPDLPCEVHLFGSDADFPAYYSQLQRLAEGDSRIMFRGTFPNREIGRVFSELDVLAVPSVWYENTPLVVLSAQACGCPVVASDLGGLSEAVRHGENGLLFPTGNAKELANALARLHADRALLGRLAANSRPPRPMADYVSDLLAAYEAAMAKWGKYSCK